MYQYIPYLIRGPRGCPGPRGLTGPQGPSGSSGGGSSNYKGEYGTSADLIAANPDSALNDYGYVSDTASFWYYSPTLGTYINSEVTAAEYLAYPQSVRDEVPFVIVPG